MSNIEISEQFHKLCEAIKKKDKETIKRVLLNDINVNLEFKSLQSPLHLAIIHFDDIEVIKMLLEKKADVNAKNYQQKTPLQLVVQLNKTKIFELLINIGVDPGDQNLNTLLNIATKQGNLTIVKHLIDLARKKHVLIDREKSFDVAVKRGFVDIVKYFLPFIKFEKFSDRFILPDIVLKNSKISEVCIDILLQHGFIINPKWTKDEKFIYLTVVNGHKKIIEGLLNLGVDVNIRHESVGFTLLHIACLNGYFEIVELFIKHKVDVNLRVTDRISTPRISQTISTTEKFIGKTALYIAVQCTNIKLVQLLLDNGAIIHNDSDFFSMASVAIKKNQKAILELLLDHGGNANVINNDKETLLHLCAKMNESHNQKNLRQEICELLLIKGAKADAQCSKGRTPLIEAIRNHYNKITRILLKYNANVNIADQEGMTVLHIACEQNRKFMIQLSLVHNANPNYQNKYSQTPLHIATNNSDVQTIRTLLENEADPNIRDKDGQTPLHIVCQSHQPTVLNIIKLLLDYGVDIDAMDINGRTPLFYASTQVNKSQAVSFENVDFVSIVKYVTRCQIPGYDFNFVNCWKNFDSTKLLLANNANINITYDKGLTLLHLAVENDKLDLAETLINIGIDVNSLDALGRTALHIAASNGNIQIVESLLKCGADINISDCNHKTAFHYIFDGINRLQNNYEENYNTSHCNENSINENANDYQYKIDSYIKIFEIFKGYVLELMSHGLNINKQNADFLTYEILVSDHNE